MFSSLSCNLDMWKVLSVGKGKTKTKTKTKTKENQLFLGYRGG